MLIAVWTLTWARPLLSPPSSKTSTWRERRARRRRRSPRGARWRWRPRRCRRRRPTLPPCGPQRGGRLARDLARLAVVRADVGAAGVGLAVGVDRDDDLARLLKLPHLVGDAGRLGLEDRDGDALDVGQAQGVFEQADLPLRVALVAPQLDPGPELLAAVLHPLLDGVPPVGVAVGDEQQPRTRRAAGPCLRAAATRHQHRQRHPPPAQPPPSPDHGAASTSILPPRSLLAWSSGRPRAIRADIPTDRRCAATSPAAGNDSGP